MLERDLGKVAQNPLSFPQKDGLASYDASGPNSESIQKRDEITVTQIRENLAKITEGTESQHDLKPKVKRSNWEPFLKEPVSEQRFINLYGGVYSAQMELNRKKAEELIRVAALEGNIFLTSLQATRTRSTEANPDGLVTTKRRLFWGEKPTKVEQNPNFQVTSIPEGWKIEICDQKIFDDFEEKFAGEELQKKFVATFNHHLRAGIWEATRREKLTSTKDERIVLKYFVEGVPVGSAPIFASIGGYDIFDVIYLPSILLTHGFINYMSTQRGYQARNTLSSLVDYFMPFVEIDRVVRGFLYLNLKGRNLVRLQGNKQ